MPDSDDEEKEKDVAVERPWIIKDPAEKLAAYKALCDCDIADAIESDKHMHMVMKGAQGWRSAQQLNEHIRAISE